MRYQRKWLDSDKWEVVSRKQFVGAYQAMGWKAKYLPTTKDFKTELAEYRKVQNG